MLFADSCTDVATDIISQLNPGESVNISNANLGKKKNHEENIYIDIISFHMF